MLKPDDGLQDSPTEPADAVPLGAPHLSPGFVFLASHDTTPNIARCPTHLIHGALSSRAAFLGAGTGRR
jgi:hypothetical protein